MVAIALTLTFTTGHHPFAPLQWLRHRARIALTGRALPIGAARAARKAVTDIQEIEAVAVDHEPQAAFENTVFVTVGSDIKEDSLAHRTLCEYLCRPEDNTGLIHLSHSDADTPRELRELAKPQRRNKLLAGELPEPQP